MFGYYEEIYIFQRHLNKKYVTTTNPTSHNHSSRVTCIYFCIAPLKAYIQQWTMNSGVCFLQNKVGIFCNPTKAWYTVVPGLLERIAQLNAQNPSIVKTYLCSAVDHYASTYGDRGWGCGYRYVFLTNYASQCYSRFLLHLKRESLTISLFFF